MKWLLWVLELALIALGVAWLLPFRAGTAGVLILVAWNAVAVLYLGFGWRLMHERLPAARQEAELRDLVGPQWYSSILATVASGSGLASGLAIVTSHSGHNSTRDAIAATTIFVSWTVLHAAYSNLYARAFVADGGLEFPKCEYPTITEFVYFSFTIGTSFATSDVNVLSSPMRRKVAVHSVLGFFFNAVVVAVAIDWIKS
ncbi:DUF1345 domain-containing protein [Actinomadura rupiterrae]|uniref:DUF1345 domain-containing protein n=1 Tax=Actinomadura rupiterrae TaxID=559627 RepID=UPI0020A46E7D|nr:DUF1345 domain-containing protein [Actinomadura rupiterrae]